MNITRFQLSVTSILSFKKKMLSLLCYKSRDDKLTTVKKKQNRILARIFVFPFRSNVIGIAECKGRTNKATWKKEFNLICKWPLNDFRSTIKFLRRLKNRNKNKRVDKTPHIYQSRHMTREHQLKTSMNSKWS